MKRINDLEQQLNKKGASLTEKKAGKELADDMLTHVSGGKAKAPIKATWTLRF
ncbi:MAG: hypothetical protein ACI9J4_001354 [Paraglaciecola sp.]|jgi:hypothetical protein|tara:strand:+ start:343 stop:501 length:159 start_codon:yes stop_codon:yes gene_type:complete